ncbi:complex I intermediate-associated protein 30-domain-containing protein [Gorgonomyces haynaldii]|nr:complex I intermediate-associated protein 30-domain-containing protein [Gorgonomyces haynaldii]
MQDYFKRSLKYVKGQTVAALNVFDEPWRRPLLFYKFEEPNVLKEWAIGSDADFGGYSQAFFGTTDHKTALFWGTLSTEKPQNPKIEHSGYAGIRSKELPKTLLHTPRHDCSLYRYLEIRAKGDTKQWFVNLRTESIYPSHVWQHRLYFSKPGEWEVIRIPFRDFVLTSHGFVQKQYNMDRAKIKTVGFSILRQPGDFKLELDYIQAINDENTIGDHDLR